MPSIAHLVKVKAAATAAGTVAAGLMLSLAAAAPARAQARSQPAEASGAEEAEIVVTGERRALRERIAAYIADVTSETGNAQVARWDRRLCIAFEGVSPQQQAFFAAAVAEPARALDLEVERGRCDPSALIIFSTDPAALLSRINATRPGFFGTIPPARQRALAQASAPIRWLSYAQLRGAEGEAPSSFRVEGQTGGAERPVPLLRTSPSRIEGGARMDLQSMLVLVDATRLAGVSNRSLADYLAMVVLGNVRPDHRTAGAGSILGIFGEARPGALVTEGLTAWDRAYLRALYSGSSNLPAAQRMQRIAAGMERVLAHDPGAPAE